MWVFNRVILTLLREGAFLDLVDIPSSDGVTIKIPYGIDALLHRPVLHLIFFYWVG